MNEALINILAAIFYVSEQQGVRLCYNAETRQVCRIIDDSNGVYTLLPTTATGEEPPTSHFSEASLITRNDLIKRTKKIGLLTVANGITTGEQQYNNEPETEFMTAAQRIENRTTTASTRNNNGSATEEQRLYIGSGTVNLAKISQLYTGDLAAVLVKIEAALDKIFKNTNKEATIKKYIDKYDNIKRIAAAGDLYELKLALKSLEGTIQKQYAMARGVEKFERKETLKKRVVNALIIFVFAAGALLFFRPWHWFAADGTAENSPTLPAPMAATVPTSSGSTFELAIKEFEAETGKKIYPGGRACLQSTAARFGLTTKQQIKELIKQNVK